VIFNLRAIIDITPREMQEVQETREVWVEIGDAPPCFVVLKKSDTTIFHLIL
jgi:hypothetical protein